MRHALTAGFLLFAVNASAQGTYPEGTPLAARSQHNGQNTLVYRLNINGQIVGPDIDAENFGPSAQGVITIALPALPIGRHLIAMGAVNDVGTTWSEPQVVWIVAKQPTEPANTAPDKPSTPDIIPR